MVFAVETSSDSRYDSRFDSDFAASLLLNLAQERSVDGLMEKSLSAATTQAEIACVEIWLLEQGDLCSHCPQKLRRPDQTRCLHLVAACENTALAGARESSYAYHARERIPLGAGFVDRIAATGQLAEVPNLDDVRGECSGLELSHTGGVCCCTG
jgi:hypothetical protein